MIRSVIFYRIGSVISIRIIYAHLVLQIIMKCSGMPHKIEMKNIRFCFCVIIT